MLRGIVMEVNEKKLFLLTSSGEIKEVRAPKENLMIGHEYNSKDHSFNIDYSVFKSRRFVLIMLAVLLMLPSSLSYTYFKPHGYINIDINPSIEITYNIFDRVIDVKSINIDGEKMIKDNLKIDNMKTSEAVENVITKAENLGYINGDKENLVLITVTSNDFEDISKYEEDSFKSDDYEISVIKANEKEHIEAANKGISTAKIVINNMINNEESEEKVKKLIKLYEKFEDDNDDMDLSDDNEREDFDVNELEDKKIEKELERLEKIEEIKKEREEKEKARLEKQEERRELLELKREEAEKKREEEKIKREEVKKERLEEIQNEKEEDDDKSDNSQKEESKKNK